MDTSAAAQYLGLSGASLTKMRCLGGSPAYMKVGRRVVYSRPDLDAWINARRVKNTSQGHKLPKRMIDEHIA